MMNGVQFVMYIFLAFRYGQYDSMSCMKCDDEANIILEVGLNLVK
jgi:hypothetical protein